MVTVVCSIINKAILLIATNVNMGYFVGGFILGFLIGSIGYYNQDRDKSVGHSIIFGIAIGFLCSFGFGLTHLND